MTNPSENAARLRAANIASGNDEEIDGPVYIKDYATYLTLKDVDDPLLDEDKALWQAIEKQAWGDDRSWIAGVNQGLLADTGDELQGLTGLDMNTAREIQEVRDTAGGGFGYELGKLGGTIGSDTVAAAGGGALGLLATGGNPLGALGGAALGSGALELFRQYNMNKPEEDKSYILDPLLAAGTAGIGPLLKRARAIKLSNTADDVTSKEASRAYINAEKRMADSRKAKAKGDRALEMSEDSVGKPSLEIQTERLSKRDLEMAGMNDKQIREYRKAEFRKQQEIDEITKRVDEYAAKKAMDEDLLEIYDDADSAGDIFEIDEGNLSGLDDMLEPIIAPKTSRQELIEKGIKYPDPSADLRHTDYVDRSDRLKEIARLDDIVEGRSLKPGDPIDERMIEEAAIQRGRELHKLNAPLFGSGDTYGRATRELDDLRMQRFEDSYNEMMEKSAKRASRKGLERASEEHGRKAGERVLEQAARIPGEVGAEDIITPLMSIPRSEIRSRGDLSGTIIDEIDPPQLPEGELSRGHDPLQDLLSDIVWEKAKKPAWLRRQEAGPFSPLYYQIGEDEED